MILQFNLITDTQSGRWFQVPSLWVKVQT